MEELAHECPATGNLQLLQWLHQNGVPISFMNGSVSAAYQGHVHVLDWLWSKEEDAGVRPEDWHGFDQVLQMASMEGDVEIFKWVWKTCGGIKRQYILHAASEGQLDVLRFLHVRT
jgi:hypothetical protein